MRIFIRALILLLLCVGIAGCNSQTKEQLVHDGRQFIQKGNYRGAIVFYKKALKKDQNYFEARYLLADAYLKVREFAKAEKEFKKVALQAPDFRKLQLKLAEICLYTKRMDQALEKIKSYLNKHSEDSAAYDLMGRVYATQEQFTAAKEAFNRAIRLAPQDIPAKLHLVQLYIRLGNKAEAHKLLEDIVSNAKKRDRDVRAAYFMLAELEKMAGNRDRAVSLYREIQKKFPMAIRASYMEGALLLEENKLDKVKIIVAELVKKYPSRPEGFRLKGLLAYVRKDFSEAVAELRKAIKLGGGDFISIYFLGTSYLKQGKLDLALNQFQKILDVNPDIVKARVMVGMILLKQKQIDDAIHELRKALKSDEKNAEAHNLLGSAYLNKGMYDEAMAEFDRAVELDPKLVDAYVKKGISTLVHGGNPDQVEADFIKALNAAPEVMNTRLLLSAFYVRSQNYEKALSTMRDGLTGKPSDALLYYGMAQVWLAQNREDKALEILGKAKEAKPDYFSPYFKAASIYAAQGKYPEAIAEYNALLKVDPKNTRAVTMVAALYNLQGEDDKARECFIKAGQMGTPFGCRALASYLARTGQLDEALETVTDGLRKFVDDPGLLRLQGDLFLKKDDLKQAATALLKLEKFKPGQGLPLLVRAYLSKGDTGQAVELAKKVIADRPESDYGYLLLSEIYRHSGDLDRAGKTLQQGLQAHPQSLKLRLRLGLVDELKDNNNAALQCYLEAERDFPESVDPIFARASLLDRIGDKRQALELYRKILSKDENNAICLNNLAYLYIENYNEYKKALDLAMKAYQIAPESPEIMDTLGYAFWKNGRYNEARKMLEKAWSRLKSNSMVGYHLALVYADSKEPAQAVAVLRQVLAEKKSFPKREAAEKLLSKVKKQVK